MSHDIRRATIKDAPALSRLHKRCFSDGWDEASLAALMSSPGSFALMADSMGFMLIRVAADEAEILTICVVRDDRKQGLGSALIAAASAAVAKTDAKAMFLEVAADNLPAKRLYENYGFRPVGSRKSYYGGTDAIVMKAALPLAFRMGNPAETL